MNTTLQETLGLIRAMYLFARNYKEGAPPISNDSHAMECAFLRMEEALTSAVRQAIDELYRPKNVSDGEREKVIKAEIARLECEDWRSSIKSLART